MDALTSRALFGTEELQPPTLALNAGPLSLRLQGTRLLPVYVGGHEVWHGAAFLYRDTGWGTPQPVVDEIIQETRSGGFSVRLRAHVPVQPRIDLHIEIDGDSRGQVRYAATAMAQGDIATHRTGLCVEHPMSAMEHPIEIEHTDGRTSRSTFPKLIAPWPPFMLVRAIRHEFAPGAWAECRFEGDVFELEDQRNNADASFKTYSRSNLMPRPYLLRAGVPVRQAVDLRLHSLPAASVALPETVALVVGSERRPMSRIGVGLRPQDLPDAQRLLPWLRELAPGQLHLVVNAADAPIDTHGLARLLKACGATLRLDILGLAAGEAGLDALGVALRGALVEPESVGVFPAHPPAVAAARRAFPGAAIGGGTPHFFAQINRIEDLGEVDFLSFTTSSVVHNANDASIMTGLQSLPWLVETLRATQPGRPVRVGPSGIAAGSSPLGQQPESDGSRRVALARLDPRSGALFGAAWALGHVAAFAYAGVDAISVLGLGQGEGLISQSDRLHLTPAGFVLRELSAALCNRPVSINGAGHIAALAWDHYGGSSLLVANLCGDASQVDLSGWPAGLVSVMDADSWNAYAVGDRLSPWRDAALPPGSPLRLPAYAIARLHATQGSAA